MNNKLEKPTRKKIFLENPYDLETFFESLSIASLHDKELVYMDKLLSRIRSDPSADLTTINYAILNEIGILKIEKFD